MRRPSGWQRVEVGFRPRRDPTGSGAAAATGCGTTSRVASGVQQTVKPPLLGHDLRRLQVGTPFAGWRSVDMDGRGPLRGGGLTMSEQQVCGGRNRCRSGDLALFRRALYQLSYPTAVLTGFEPATSGLTGRRALQTAPQDLATTERLGTPPARKGWEETLAGIPERRPRAAGCRAAYVGPSAVQGALRWAGAARRRGWPCRPAPRRRCR